MTFRFMPKKSKIVTSAASSLLATAVALAGLVGCGAPLGRTAPQSSLDTVNIPNSQIKWQSIGNCWIYAALGWVESLELRHSGIEVNYSESYLTYRLFQNELETYSGSSEVNTGGWFHDAAFLMRRYGMMKEGDFLPGEANLTKSAVQASALAYINESIKTGKLSKSRFPETIKAELDIAFGVNFESLKPKIISPANIIVDRDPATAQPISLARALTAWEQVAWRPDYSSYPNSNTTPTWSGTTTEAQREILKRVKRALNAGQPVMLNWLVDFNALGTDGVFSLDNLLAKGKPGRQGYHVAVIDDYTVKGIHPETGAEFTVGEGEVSPEEKVLAAEYGEVTSFILKNSWGGNERLDRPSYVRDGSKGYHKLENSFLFSWLPATDEKTGKINGLATAIHSFELPAGF